MNHYLKQLYKKPKEVFTIENVSNYCKKADSSILELADMLSQSEMISFDNGWILWKPTERCGEKIFFITSTYNANRKIDKELFWHTLCTVVRGSGFSKIEMITKRNPDAWDKMFGLKLSGYIMEYRLEDQ